jgi:hypothetical protein
LRPRKRLPVDGSQPAVRLAIGVAGFVGRSQINDVTAGGQSSYLSSRG